MSPQELDNAIFSAKAAISALDDSSKCLDHWLLIFTGLVVLGVFLEIVETIIEYKDEYHAWKWKVTWLPEKPKKALFGLKYFAIILVVAGVGGELGVNVLSIHVNNKLRIKNEELVGLVDRKAGDAKASAEGAANAAARAKDSADAAVESAAKVQKRVSAVDKRAQEIDADLARTEWIISARRVQDVDGLTDELRKEFKGRHIVLRSYVGNEEAVWLCWQLVDIAHKAEMDPKDECGLEGLTNIPMADLLIRAPTTEEGLSLARLLSKPGRVSGLGASVSQGPVLTVLIGVKRSFVVWPPKRVEAPKNKNTSNSAKP